MNSIENIIRLRWVRAALAALGLAAALATVAPTGVEAQRGRRATAAQAQDDGVVNIQTASADQLQLLPGIGPSKAQAIVQFRERRAFRRVQDLMRVRGIGRATFRRLRSMLTVDGPTTLTAPSSSSGD
jgi:competence protein ComEA